MATRSDTPETTSRSQQRVLEATLRCIERMGVDQMTMEDVAAEAGVVRKTVYLAYGNRQALLDAALLSKVGGNVAKLRRYVEGFDTLGEALLKGCTRHADLIRKDPVFFALLQWAQVSLLGNYLLGPKTLAIRMTLDIWQGVLQRARERGELRTDVSDTDIANWLLNVTSFLLTRDDLSARAKSDLLAKFLLPALLTPGAR